MVVFFGSAYVNDHLRPKVWYENDRKNMENLLEYKLRKMLIFAQKILEVAITPLHFQIRHSSRDRNQTKSQRSTQLKPNVSKCQKLGH